MVVRHDPGRRAPVLDDLHNRRPRARRTRSGERRQCAGVRARARRPSPASRHQPDHQGLGARSGFRRTGSTLDDRVSRRRIRTDARAARARRDRNSSNSCDPTRRVSVRGVFHPQHVDHRAGPALCHA